MGSNIKLTTEQFVEKAKEIHGDRYDYSLVDYTGGSNKVKIICNEPDHGVFTISPDKHKCGGGCQKCAHIQRIKSKTKMMTKEYVISKANEIHNNKYDYSLVNDKELSNRTIMTIICNEKDHGVFTKDVMSHIKGRKSGCLKCGYEKTAKSRRLTTKIFIERANKIHKGIYDYSLVEYKNNSTNVKIICSNPNHGIFEQNADHHMSGQNCPKCSAELFFTGWNEKYSFTPYLESICNYSIKPQYIVNNTTKEYRSCYYVDFYILELNICIEYDERHHKYNTGDKERQTYIENKLGCKFIRIDDRKFMEDNSYAYTLLYPLLE
jgi:hypothetical protein